MNKKLTLSIDDSLIKFAHDYSKQTKQSISSIVEKYLTTLKQSKDEKNLTNTTNELYGILAGKPLPDKKLMKVELHEKSID